MEMFFLKKLLAWIKKHMPTWGSSQRTTPTTYLPLDFNSHHPISDESYLSAVNCKNVRTTLFTTVLYNNPSAVASWVSDVQDMLDDGFNVLVLAAYEPAAWKYGTLTERYQRLTDFWVSVAAQVPGCDWELFNEWDENFFGEDIFRGGDTYVVAGKRFGNFMNVCVPQLRPYANKIYSGGVLFDSLKAGIIEAILSTIKLENIDGICVHSYGFPLPSAGYQWLSNYHRVRQSGFTKEILCTEFGMGSEQIPEGWFEAFSSTYGWANENAMADDLQKTQIMECLRTNPGYSKAFLYVIHNPDHSDFSWPIFKASGAPRPSVAPIITWNSTRTD